jgi:hypothetical protein
MVYYTDDLIRPLLRAISILFWGVDQTLSVKLVRMDMGFKASPPQCQSEKALPYALGQIPDTIK